MNYYVVGFLVGLGKKKRAAQTDTWRDLRSLAYFGLCDSERNQAHFELALCYARLAQANGSLETLSAAAKHFHAMLDLNGDIEEAQYAKANLKSIEPLLAAR